jgi:pimeloyl-ACP methyl ester carboxylesterase
LAKDHYVVSWDSRWLPCLTHRFNQEDCHSLTFARDLISVLSYFKLEQPTIVGWSSGVQVCLRAMNEFPERIGRAVLLNGGTSIQGDADMGVTDYQKNLISLLPKICNNYRMSEMYCDLIYGTKLHSKNEADQGLFTRILTSTDPYLLYMTSLPFRNAEALYRYANVMVNVFTEREDAWTTGVKHPVLVYSGMKDTVTHTDAAATIAAKLENGVHYCDENGDHFAHFYQRKVAQIIAQFIAKTDEQVADIKLVEA